MSQKDQLTTLCASREKINIALKEVLILRASDIAENLKTALTSAVPGIQPVLIESTYAHPGLGNPQRKARRIDLVATMASTTNAATIPQTLLQDWTGEYGEEEPEDSVMLAGGVAITFLKRWQILRERGFCFVL